MSDNPRRLRRPEERVGNLTNADLPPPVVTEEEASLLQRIRAQDHSAYDQLLDLFYSPMLRVAMNYVRSREEAEEVIQDTWIAVMAGIHKFNGRASFRTWLFRILINRARTRAKRESRMVTLPPTHIAFDVSSNASDPEETLLNQELAEVVERAVASLPRVQRLVVTLRDIEGWNADEVCAALKLSSNNQRVVLHRARMKVREQIVPYVDRGALAFVAGEPS